MNARNGNTAQVETEGPQLLFIKKTEIPAGTSRGRVSLLSRLSFWNELTFHLQQGLAPSEAIEIDLSPVRLGNKEIETKSLLSAIRHQFQKSGLSKHYSLILRGANRLFITDHNTAAHA